MKNKQSHNDTEALLKEQNGFLKKSLNAQQEQNKNLLNQIEQLQHTLDNLLRILYGQSSEKKSKKNLRPLKNLTMIAGSVARK
ncbi:MAG: hypothetical protein WC748_05125 [Legionellales bacterium]|jgi:uncharacterized protein YlxW (UPF0749 family)